ncbi:ABC transporter ATP-binding protein, partial [Serratia marcescens]|nr:ABC transporter ATP-binding protein [Serratia marcescens]
LAMAVAGLLPKQARQTGSIVFPGTSGRPRLGRDIGVVFQDPGGSIDPVMRVGDQIAEVIRAHEDTSWIAARVRAADLMDRVRIPKALSRLNSY